MVDLAKTSAGETASVELVSFSNLLLLQQYKDAMHANRSATRKYFQLRKQSGISEETLNQQSDKVEKTFATVNEARSSLERHGISIPRLG